MRISSGFNHLTVLLALGACLTTGAGGPAAGEPAEPGASRPGPAAKGLRWPLDPPLGLRSAFGEFREGGRVHGGLDLSTGGRTGLPVRAMADGEVFQVKVEWRGYGRAVYQRLRDGRIAVYAHLESFVLPGLEEAVSAARARRGRYPGDVPIQPPRPARQGEVLALSGESGAGLPHLHFEIRTRDNRPTDPLQNGLARDLEDTTAPVFESLWIFAARPGAWVEGAAWSRRFGVRSNGAGSWESEPVRASGAIDLAVEVHDASPDGSRLGVSALRLRWDGREVSASRAGGFDFDQARRAAAIHDGDLSHLSPTRFFYRPLAPRESPWQLRQPQGVLEGRAGTRHLLEIEVDDASGNNSILRASVQFMPETELVRASGAGNGAAAGEARDRGWQVDLSSADWLAGMLALPLAEPRRDRGADVTPLLYRLRHDSTGRPLLGRIWSDADGAPGEKGFLVFALPDDGKLRFEPVGGGGPLRSVQRRMGTSTLELTCAAASLRVPRGALPSGTPVTLIERTQPEATAAFRAGGAAVRIEPAWRIPALPVRLRLAFEAAQHQKQRLGVYRWDPLRSRWVHAGGTGEAGSAWLEVELGDLGTFRLLEDTAPPRWGEQQPAPGQRMKPRGWSVVVGLEDAESGIDWDGAGIRLDGRELEAEFDPDRKKLEAAFEGALQPGSHRLQGRARDRAGNETPALEWEFMVVPEP